MVADDPNDRTTLQLNLLTRHVRLRWHYSCWSYRGADKSLARPGRKQTWKHLRDEHDFNNMETRAVFKFFLFFLQGKAPKEINAILTEILACFLPGRAKDLLAPLYEWVLFIMLARYVGLGRRHICWS